MIEFSQSEVRAYYAARLPKLKSAGKEMIGPCPVHHGKDDNFKIEIATGRAYCHSVCQRGWDLISLEQELTGRGFIEAKVSVFQVVGRPEISYADRDIVAMYDYCNEHGNVLYQVVRRAPGDDGKKRFSQRRPDGKGGWVPGLGNVPQVPFMLPKVITATGIVAIVEGERDAQSLDRIAIVATCNNGGAGNFKPELAQWFNAKKVAIFPDNDEAGRSHALKVAALLKSVASSVRIVELPGLEAKGDVTEFLSKGGTKAQIREAYDRAAEWTPEWEFGRSVPSEEDRYVKTPVQIIEEAGGLDAFWRLPEDEGLPTPFYALTRAMAGGLRNGEVYVIGGDTGSGKTSLVLQFAMTVLQRRKGVLMFSMEMGHSDVIQRMASMEARVDLLKFREYQRLRSPVDIEREEMRRALGKASVELMDLPLLVSDKGGVDYQYVLSETERLSHRFPIHLVILDHMQLMSASDVTRGDTEKFTSISREGKRTAKEMGIPVIEASQTRKMGSSKDVKFELEIDDLRSSGAIAEDACTVMLLYPDRDDYIENQKTNTLAIGPIKTWLKLGKNRFGWKDWSLPLMHYKTCTRFDVMEEQ